MNIFFFDSAWARMRNSRRGSGNTRFRKGMKGNIEKRKLKAGAGSWID